MSTAIQRLLVKKLESSIARIPQPPADSEAFEAWGKDFCRDLVRVPH
jgi:hypothetical protein